MFFSFFSHTYTVSSAEDEDYVHNMTKNACELTLNPNTAHRELSLSEGNRRVTRVWVKQLCPDHPERFRDCPQVLCREGLTGQCYWETEWSGKAYIGVAYRGINKHGEANSCVMGFNDKSWSLECSNDIYTAWHNNKSAVVPVCSSRSNRVRVHLDYLHGHLSFYSISSGSLTQLHTFNTTFTEPLYPGFVVWDYGSSVSLCKVKR
uniref:B30.2/SPRY domain-containing protein n=1 Tax=Hucho hucho TaxID=62062 RepID=A0A4W5NX64_9TELE